MSKFSRIFTAVTCATAVTASGLVPAFAAEGATSPVTITGAVDGTKCTLTASEVNADALTAFKNSFAEKLEAGIAAAKTQFGLDEQNYTKFVAATKGDSNYNEVAAVIKQKDNTLTDDEVAKLHLHLAAAQKLIESKDNEKFGPGLKAAYDNAAKENSVEVSAVDAKIEAIKAAGPAAKTEKLAVIETPLAVIPETINGEVVKALGTCSTKKDDKSSRSSDAKDKLNEFSSIVKDKNKENFGEKLLTFFSSLAAAIGLGKVFEKIVEFFKNFRSYFKA
ncbi:MAG: hypothetical protein Q4D85_09940 [Corynebacterium sp.]|uniref:hypothetical protein n=1 Tax=Corynebacterium sp. TaxID=1720 RepID=UPI0026DB1EDE|nr:hypothetical protein [Corynebacterium sp.]MDO5099064.1 hypothetical protein [Corynebacterium sp.]